MNWIRALISASVHSPHCSFSSKGAVFTPNRAFFEDGPVPRFITFDGFLPGVSPDGLGGLLFNLSLILMFKCNEAKMV